MTANERIKYLRKTLNMSMESFGAVIGLSKSGVSAIESSTREVSEKHIKMLTAKPINGRMVSEEWLRDEIGEPFLSEDDQLMGLLGELAAERPDSFRKRFLTTLLRIPPDRWGDIQAFVENLK